MRHALRYRVRSLAVSAADAGVLRQLVVAIVIGGASGAMLGAIACVGLFALVDFSRNPSDLVVLTIYSVVHFAVAGAVVAASLATLVVVAVAVIRRGAVPLPVLSRALAVFMIGAVVLVVASAMHIVARRPTLLLAPATIMPILCGAFLLFALSYFAARPAGNDSGLRARQVRLKAWGLLLVASLVVPPLYGLRIGATAPARAVESLHAPDGSTSSDRRVLVIGWDSASWDMVGPLLDEGRLPNLARLLPSSSWGVLWATPQEIQPFADSASAGIRSPAAWETIATGKLPRQHGLWDFRSKLFAGVEQAIPFRIAGEYLGGTVQTTSEMSRAERVWAILDRAGLGTAVVGWWNTWPVRPLRAGVVISENAQKSSLERAMYPEDAVDIATLCEGADSAALVARQRVIGGGSIDRDEEADGSASKLMTDLMETFVSEYRRDLCNAEIAIDAAKRYRPAMLAVHFSMADVSQHKFWRYYEPEAFTDVPDDLVSRFGDVIPAAYAFLDQQLGRVIESMGEETTILLVSDHGAGPWRATGLHTLTTKVFQRLRGCDATKQRREFSGNHRNDGIVVLRGSGIVADNVLDGAEQSDITPTLLHLFGLPAASDMQGEVLVDAFSDEELRRNPPRSIPTYESGNQYAGLRPTRSAIDAELEERLRNIGYLR